jgi:MFS family permease
VAWTAAAVFLVALAIYIRTMLPGTSFWDTGEAQTVPPTLSIFHPTGFPAYTLVGWLWSRLPLGEVAWRMNLLSGVSIAGAAGLAVLVIGQLAEERHRVTVAAAAAIGGLAFAFASEPWRDAVRADVHALHALLAALVIWLLVSWASARSAHSPGADRWLMAASLTFGIGMSNHPLIGLMAFGIGAWLFIVDPAIWRRWKLVLACGLLLALGLALYGYILLRAWTPPEPPLFYARPTTLERFRYLVFAEQFHDLFRAFDAPLADLGFKWADAERVLERQFIGPGWLIAGVGAAVLAARRLGAFVFLGLLAAGNVLYAMNFRDGDIDRYYLLTVWVGAVAIGLAVSAVAGAAGRTLADATRRALGISGRRRAAVAGALVAMLLAAALPVGSLVVLYRERDRSNDFDAERWVAAVHEALPDDAVIISWWSYSTPLWYHRWIEGERPDVKIIDERNILDDGYGTIGDAVEAFLGRRPVYIVPPSWEMDAILARWEIEAIQTYPGFSELWRVVGRR